MRPNRRLRILASAVVLATGLGAAGAFAGSSQPSAAAVSAKLVEWKLISSATSVPAGKVTFRVANEGALEHEFVVVRFERHHHLLPMKRGQASTTALLGRTGRIAPGRSTRLTLKLKPGKYVLLCNLLGHYKAGQFAALRVR